MQIKGDLNVVFLLETIRDRYVGLLHGHQISFLLEVICIRRQTFGPGMPSEREQADLLRELDGLLCRDSVSRIGSLLDVLNGQTIARKLDDEILH